MSHVQAGNAIAEKPALVAEILGPAGVGKTTLASSLSQRNKKILVGVQLQKASYIPFYISTAFLLLPAFLSQDRNGRWFTWGEIRAIVYLKAWHHALERRTPNNDTITILDHGPIYRLALLREFGPDIIKSQRLRKWWDSMLSQWAGTLDMVIWLDAPDAILMERIQTRKRWHLVKDISEQEGYMFLARFRKVFEQIISMLKVVGGPRILCLETDKEPANQIVDKVLAALDAQFSKS